MFKKENDWRDDKNWWKSPVLQGPENDYGDYDYLVRRIPKDVSEFRFRRYKQKCDSCKKNTHFYHYDESHFYTIDGYDSMDYHTCWRCILKGKINHIKYRIKNKKEDFKLRFEIWKEMHKHV